MLVGGRGTRLGGVDKASLALADGRTLFEHVRTELTSQVARVFRVGRADQVARGDAEIEDGRADAGPLAGIEAALRACRAPWCVVVAVDLPRFDAELVDVLAAARAPNVRCAVPEHAGGLEPLCSIWSSRLAPELTHLLDRGERAAHAALRSLSAARVPLPDRLVACLHNLNSPADLHTLSPR